MTDDLLIELVGSAHRARDPHGVIQWSPAWHDLGPEQRREAHDAAARARVLESALDPDGLSSSAHAVLARIRGAR